MRARLQRPKPYWCEVFDRVPRRLAFRANGMSSLPVFMIEEMKTRYGSILLIILPSALRFVLPWQLYTAWNFVSHSLDCSAQQSDSCGAADRR